ncbi:(2R)-3-sulfolactate dehydrogenase (NADP(+)) [Helicoverpa zea]|uniref:(2R)-3-sulfolactate dehydrogenase (NADP(+)) n=1 Tax=Helicoverpa zea TaxID=7113 RepID=UPI001F578611|nr:(2R)-3-sulfolactate dehydrogenase (NADP(+)) [Helicoverpa zea]
MPEVKLEEVRRFMEDSLKAVGTPESEAKAHADLLMHADTVGHYSHGLNRLEFYINDCQSGACVPTAKPEVLKESGATAWVDGHNALGATVGNFCMDVAIKKAKECGVGWVSAKRSNHFGMAGYWALKAEREGLIGMAFTNSSPIMVPTRSKQRALGTNPIAMAAPASGDDKLVVDMATTTVAMGKIEVQIHKEEPIPQGWALGSDGKSTTDAKAAFSTGRLMPLGGEEKTSGYKGYALSAMVETFCSGLSGSKSTHNIRGWELTSTQGPPDLGQCFAAIDPECFAPGFAERVADCLNTWRSLEPVDPALPVLAPGDKEDKIGKTTLAKGTVNYPEKQIQAMRVMAERIGVKPIQTIST